ncbi:MAG: deoxyribodipyrimidine photolyase [Thermoanaerobaculia bacterium]|nr:deoxyribodipyrimidine photolyase [Thermoanaerobaculia bacterium]
MMIPAPSFAPHRLRLANDRPPDPAGDYVLYWMLAARRTRYNFALERAAELARALGKPLVIFEGLRVGYRWASDRFHHFVLAGMADNRRRLAGGPALYYPWIERQPGEGKGLLVALARRAAVVVSDEYPGFFLPRALEAAARQLPVRLEAVDGYGLLPIREPGRAFFRAVDFRRHLQKHLAPHLEPARFPREDALGHDLPFAPADLLAEIHTRWPAVDPELAAQPEELARLPIDHQVSPAGPLGGELAAQAALGRFLDRGLPRYVDDRLELDDRATSGLSPYLHFGHLSAHEVFLGVVRREHWHVGKMPGLTNGSKEGWWGLSPTAEAFLDQLVTWREVGANTAHHERDFDRYESLPAWCRRTLGDHEGDPRPVVYSPAELEAAATHDPIWNAAQRELVTTGTIHNYLRMLWGKKVLEWSPSPRAALDVLVHLNNKYALDGRDPNSYSGIFWCFGRYDRPWVPERPIFGTIRFMSSDSTRKKLDLTRYLRRFGG